MIIAFIVQEGGCDYSIECGTKIVQLGATTLDAAWKEVEEYWDIEGVCLIQLFEGNILDQKETRNV